jgi:hypothetical protein
MAFRTITPCPNGLLLVEVESDVSERDQYLQLARELAIKYPNNRTILFVGDSCDKYLLRCAKERNDLVVPCPGEYGVAFHGVFGAGTYSQEYYKL